METFLTMWPATFGQAVTVEAGSVPGAVPTSLLILAAIAAVTVISLVPIVLGIRAQRHKQEMEHAERIRAIECGRPIPGEAGWWTPGRTAGTIGVGVPAAVFGIAFVASSADSSAAPFIWPSAGAVGVAAVICGTVLAARTPAPRPTPPDPRAKPDVDPDAYDAAEHQHA
ncbi:hypothetical protein [Tautonia sociabilis]|uniref:Uncharacterized protein n=1 Tax=Tautonia sociabilis TaxID=2080755 RepID=A0A432MD09_9BACT|nr:hypothetical protein [Tautonia sociabilis]RUL82339.1 hypothetical protein TsocGM_23580 [Tautonia sociabilis]